MGRKRTTPLETSCILTNKGNHHAVCLKLWLSSLHFPCMIDCFFVGSSTFCTAYTVARKLNNFYPQCLKPLKDWAVLSCWREYDVQNKVRNLVITLLELGEFSAFILERPFLWNRNQVLEQSQTMAAAKSRMKQSTNITPVASNEMKFGWVCKRVILQ